VCTKYREPKGVFFRFQVSLNKVDPLHSVGNLFAKYSFRAALRNEVEPSRP
jgi:hypothetical protein